MSILLTALLAIAPPGAALAAQVAPAPRNPTSLVEFSGQMRSLSQRVAPAVVQIVVTGYGSLEPESGRPVSAFGRQESIGSGVIVDPEGYIVTNAHVVKGAMNTRVVLSTAPDSH